MQSTKFVSGRFNVKEEKRKLKKNPKDKKASEQINHQSG